MASPPSTGTEKPVPCNVTRKRRDMSRWLTTRLNHRRWQRPSAEADEVAKPVAHNLNRKSPVRCGAWSGFFGIATTDGTSDVAEKRGDREIAFGFIQRQRFGIITSGLQDYRTKT